MERKFEDIKVGDEILVESEISYGWNTSNTFLIKDTVDKVTKTQFVTVSGKRFGKDGRIIGNRFSRAYHFGDKYGFRERVAKDESEERKEFIQKLNIEKKIREITSQNFIKLNSGLSLKKLQSIHLKLSEIVKDINK